MLKEYSLDYLNSISGGDKEFIQDMIETFVKSVPVELARMKTAIDQKDWYKIGEIAHKFGSNLMYLELDNLKPIIDNIETYGLEMEHIDEIPVLFEKLTIGCDKIIAILKNDFDFLNV
jgi:HPt (histidine-containing phosphotransfer) domain-containing protein